ncbi:unnamed protein product [Closterium sp. Naga37s-1]|nr:unnamed protein product [Closterium sp. Naga37s-1]
MQVCHTLLLPRFPCHAQASTPATYAAPLFSLSALSFPASPFPSDQVPFAPLAIPHTPLFLQGIISSYIAPPCHVPSALLAFPCTPLFLQGISPSHAAPAYPIGADPAHTHIPPFHWLPPLPMTPPFFHAAPHLSCFPSSSHTTLALSPPGLL